MANARINPLPAIGVDAFYYALMTSDTSADTKPVYDASERVPGLVSVAFNPNAQTGTFYADNGPYAAAAQLGEISLTVGLADIPPDIRAIWFGQPYEGGVLQGTQINPPDMAVGYRIKLSDNHYRYFWFLKCKATPPSETTNTQGSSISFQSGTITITCVIPVSYDAAWRMLDDLDPNLPVGVTPAMIGSAWFSDPLWDPEVTA